MGSISPAEEESEGEPVERGAEKAVGGAARMGASLQNSFFEFQKRVIGR